MHPDLLENSKTIYLGHIDEMYHVSSCTALCNPNQFNLTVKHLVIQLIAMLVHFLVEKKYQKIFN